jgi:hypothetical protein
MAGCKQIGIVLVDLLGHEHALIDNGLVGKAGDVELMAAGHFGVADGVLGAFADDVELALEGHVIGELRVAPDEDLAHERLGRPLRYRREMNFWSGTERQPRTVWPSSATTFSKIFSQLARWAASLGR